MDVLDAVLLLNGADENVVRPPDGKVVGVPVAMLLLFVNGPWEFELVKPPDGHDVGVPVKAVLLLAKDVGMLEVSPPPGVDVIEEVVMTVL